MPTLPNEAIESHISDLNSSNGDLYLYASRAIDIPRAPQNAGILTAVIGPSYRYCSCVSYARSISPKPIVQPTNARDVRPNSWVPAIGSWVIFEPGGEYQYYGHVGVVMGIDYGNQKIKVLEANYVPCQRGERWISIDDPAIVGYFK